MGFLPAGGSGVQVASLTLTSAQLLAIFSTPVAILPAPGPGLAILPIFACFNYRFGGTPYTPGAGSLSVGPNNLGLIQVPNTGFIDQGASQMALVRNGTTAVQVEANWVNQPLNVFSSVANPTVGNGTVAITVPYYVMAVA